MAPRILGWVFGFALTSACGKTEPPSLPDAGAERPRAAAAAAAVKVEAPRPPDPSFQLPAAERIIAIGDLHGDVSALRAALRLGGAIDDGGRWIGKKLVVVQTGDQLDRGDDEPQILELFARLRGEAEAAGGAVHVL